MEGQDHTPMLYSLKVCFSLSGLAIIFFEESSSEGAKMLLGDIVRQNAMKFPNKTALIYGDTRLTYLELNNQANRLANALLDIGMTKGDRVAVLADNCPEYVVTYFACAKSGLIIVPVNTTLDNEGIAYIINGSEANTVIFGENYADLISSMQSRLSTVRHYIVIGQAPDCASYQEITAKHTSDEPEVALSDDDIAWLCYTSGTTGVPKGVMLSHKNIISNVTGMIISGYPIGRNEINLCLVPLTHATGMLHPLIYYIVGATNVLLERYDPKLVLELIQREKVTATIITSPLLASIIDYPGVRNYDVSSLRLALSGGAPIPEGSVRKFNRIFGDIIMAGYGMTEASSFIMIIPLLEGPLSKVRRGGSCGRELVNVEARVVNEEGEDAAPGEVGELLAAGDNVMKGYWHMPEETAKTLEGGYLHTSDLAMKDKEGYYYITGRKKDMIITAGQGVLSPEIENVISLHAAVSEVAVIGAPDKELGEIVQAFVALKKGENTTEQEIIEWCSSQLEDYKVPKLVKFVDSLPKTASGKVQKTALEKQG